MSSVLDNPGVRHSALRLSVDQYHKLCAAGIVPENTELIAGIVVTKMGKSPLHTWTVQFLADCLRASVHSEQSVRVEQPLTLETSEPEPDIAVVRGSRDDFRTSHPATAELVVEVSLSSEDIDREKAGIYAAAGIPEYWIVLPQSQQVLIFRNLDRGTYAVVETTSRIDSLRFGETSLACSELFPE